MKKRIAPIILVAVLVLMAAVTTGCAMDLPDKNQITQEITVMKTIITSVDDLQQLIEMKSLKKLDLQGSDLTEDQFETLRTALPDCDILWDVPFQGGTAPSDSGFLTVSTLTREDIDQLRYFPSLVGIDANQCSDYEILAVLLDTRPELDVSYQVTIGGKAFPRFTQHLALESIDPAELTLALRCLPQVNQVTLTLTPADPDVLLELQQSYPDITFTWPMEVCGVLTDNTATFLNLADIPMEDTQALEACLKYMPNLEKVDMCGCGISNEEMEALNNRHPDTLFVWMVNIGPYTVRTDITYYIPVKYQQRVGQEDCKNLRYCTELVALDLGHMPIVTCEFVSYMPHLKYLIMADSSLTNIEPLADLKELVFLEIFLTYVKDYSPLLSVTSLEDLNICHTHGDMEPLTQMTWLKRLWWGGNPGDQLSDAEHDYLQSCLPNTQLVTDLVYSTGRGWRQGGHYYDMRDYFGMWYMDQD